MHTALWRRPPRERAPEHGGARCYAACTGFNTLYVKAPAGFGSAGLLDELGLFMWGLTADVAQGALQRLPK